MSLDLNHPSLQVVPVATPDVYVHRLPTSSNYEVNTSSLSSSNFYSFTRTSNEISIIDNSEHTATVECTKSNNFDKDKYGTEGPWSVFKLRGPFDMSLLGILAQLSQDLAKHKVSIFVVSTYDTDWFLIKKTQADLARNALESEGWVVLDNAE